MAAGPGKDQWQVGPGHRQHFVVHLRYPGVPSIIEGRADAAEVGFPPVPKENGNWVRGGGRREGEGVRRGSEQGLLENLYTEREGVVYTAEGRVDLIRWWFFNETSRARHLRDRPVIYGADPACGAKGRRNAERGRRVINKARIEGVKANAMENDACEMRGASRCGRISNTSNFAYSRLSLITTRYYFLILTRQETYNLKNNPQSSYQRAEFIRWTVEHAHELFLYVILRTYIYAHITTLKIFFNQKHKKNSFSINKRNHPIRARNFLKRFGKLQQRTAGSNEMNRSYGDTMILKAPNGALSDNRAWNLKIFIIAEHVSFRLTKREMEFRILLAACADRCNVLCLMS